MAFENDFAKPEHPLPKEIQEMKRDETVCQFCGVSYLIHNEIKKLEDEIVKLKRELEKYDGCDAKEAELRAEVKEENRRCLQLQNELIKEKARHENADEEFHKLAQLKIDVEKEHESLKVKLKDEVIKVESLKKNMKMIHYNIELMNKNVQNLKEQKAVIINCVGELKQQFRVNISDSTKFLFLMRSKYKSEKEKILHDNEEMISEFEASKRRLQNMEDEFKKFNDKREEDRKEFESALFLKSKEVDEFRSEMRQLQSEKVSMSDTVIELKTLLSEKDKKLNELEVSVEVAEKSLKDAREKEMKQKGNFEKVKENFCEQLNELKRINLDLKTSQKEEKEATSMSSIQLKVLKECLDKSKTEVSLLKKEREDMTEAHQNRIKQLRDSFNQKMFEAENWPKELEARLQDQKQKFNQEKNDLLEELTLSFQKEMESLRSLHEKEKKDIEKNEKMLKIKIKEQLETLQRRSREEIENLKTSLSKDKEKHSKINQSQEILIQNLELKISDLERRLSALQQKPVEDPSFKQKYMEAKRAMECLREDFDRMEKELWRKKQELDVLQETVRRECEERFELTEALSEARLQLLASQKKPKSLTKLNSSVLVPSPPSTSSSRSMKENNSRTKRVENLEQKISSTQCSVGQDMAITYGRKSNSEESSRKRIADAVGKRRASSRASFDKF